MLQYHRSFLWTHIRGRGFNTPVIKFSLSLPARSYWDRVTMVVQLCSPCSNILFSYGLCKILRRYLNMISICFPISQLILVQLRKCFFQITSQLYSLSAPMIPVSKATSLPLTLDHPFLYIQNSVRVFTLANAARKNYFTQNTSSAMLYSYPSNPMYILIQKTRWVVYHWSLV